MQILFSWDNLHEMSFMKNKNSINVSSAKLVQSVVTVFTHLTDASCWVAVRLLSQRILAYSSKDAHGHGHVRVICFVLGNVDK